MRDRTGPSECAFSSSQVLSLIPNANVIDHVRDRIWPCNYETGARDIGDLHAIACGRAIGENAIVAVARCASWRYFSHRRRARSSRREYHTTLNDLRSREDGWRTRG